MRLDHIVFACSSLAQAAVFGRTEFRVELPEGGSHAVMGTHNLLTRIAPGVFLEFIAIDPDAPAPARPRWFALDRLAAAGALEAGPRLVGWVASHDDLQAARENQPRLVPHAITVTRGARSWDISIAEDGEPVERGVMPALIDWLGGASPAAGMQDVGISLRALELIHPDPLALAQSLRGLGLSPVTQPNNKLRFTQGRRPGLALHLDTPRGRLEYRGGNL